MNFHVSPSDGVARECSAQDGACPYKIPADQHGGTREEAQEHYARSMDEYLHRAPAIPSDAEVAEFRRWGQSITEEPFAASAEDFYPPHSQEDWDFRVALDSDRWGANDPTFKVRLDSHGRVLVMAMDGSDYTFSIPTDSGGNRDRGALVALRMVQSQLRDTHRDRFTPATPRAEREIGQAQRAIRASQSPEFWMGMQFQQLNQDDPMVLGESGTWDNTLGTEMAVVNPQHVVQVPASHGWGQANNRPESYGNIARGLLENVDTWSKRMNAGGPPHLVEIHGPQGPVYRVGRDGRHRSESLKALGVTEWPCEVTRTSNLRAGDPFEGRNMAHRHRLQAAGLVDAQGRVARDLEYQWELDEPEYVAEMSRAYQRQYPSFGQTERERAMLNANTWAAHLDRLGGR